MPFTREQFGQAVIAAFEDAERAPPADVLEEQYKAYVDACRMAGAFGRCSLAIASRSPADISKLHPIDVEDPHSPKRIAFLVVKHGFGWGDCYTPLTAAPR